MPLATHFQVFSIDVRIIMRYKVANDYMYIGSSTLKKMKWDEDCLPGRIKHRECRNNLEHSAGEGED